MMRSSPFPRNGTGCEELFPLLKQYANPGPHYFDDDAFTDMPEKELVAELVREKPCCSCGGEIPTASPSLVERFKERPDSDLIDISVEICCERKSHKGMIIGKGGQMLKNCLRRPHGLRGTARRPRQPAMLGQGARGLAR